MVDISKGILDIPKENLKQLQKEKTAANKAITEANVEIKTAARNLANSEKKLKNFQADEEETTAAMTKYEERLEQMAEEAAEVKEKLELVQVECENLGREIAERAKAKKGLDAQTQKLEAEKIDLDHKLEKGKEHLETNEHERKSYAVRLEKLKLHDIESLENGCFVGDETDSMEQDERQGEQLRTYDEEDLGRLFFFLLKQK